jgi:hypothetical protein
MCLTSSAAALDGNPRAHLSTNQHAYSPGDVLQLHLALEPGSQNNVVDGWVGIEIPGGGRYYLQADLKTLSGTPAPAVRAYSIRDFSRSILTLEVPAHLPPGLYTLLAVGVAPGASPFDSTQHVTNLAALAVTLKPKPTPCGG